MWPADYFVPELDEARCLLLNATPRCPRCGAIARPNILMFSDSAWVDGRSEAQQRGLRRRLDGVQGLVVVVEIGAGTAVPSVRHFSQAYTRRGARLVRINVREPAVADARDVGIAAPALATLQAIATMMAG